MNDTTENPNEDVAGIQGEDLDPVTERLEALELIVSGLRDENAKLTNQLDILGRVVIAQEKTFETRSRSSVRKTLESLLHLMEHQDQYVAEASNMSGITGPNQDIQFTLEVVDGEEVKENKDSFFATKLEDGTIGLSAVETPEEYVQGRGDHIKAFLATKDFLFQDSKRRLFNYTEAKLMPEVKHGG